MAYDINSITSAMSRKINQMDHVTNNLANSMTPGFKAEHLRALQANSEGDGTPSEATIDFRAGLSQQTGNPLDLHIEGDAFFVIQTKEGLAFTRRGDFTINRDNQLVTQDGNPVMGEGGKITLRDGKVQIGRDGSVLVDGTIVGKLRMTDFNNRAALTRIGGGLYRDSGSAEMKKHAGAEIASGFLELSNVNVIGEMTELIDINRTFEIYQKIIQTLSDQDKLSVSRIGRLA
jgi:flagellar basal-body rod protein FlgF